VKPTLQLKLSQSLTLTPQLQQSIRLLQLSTLELQQEISQMLADNPLLEQAELDAELAQPLPKSEVVSGLEQEQYVKTSNNDEAEAGSENDIPDWADASTEWPGSAETDDEDDLTFQHVADDSLRAHLLAQLPMLKADPVVLQWVHALIDAIDDDGYLAITREECNAMLPPEQAADEALWQEAIACIQDLDPTGVGARDLQECLVLQMEEIPAKTAYVQLALRMLKEQFEWVKARDLQRLRRLFRTEEFEIKAAFSLIQTLNPKPGALYSGKAANFILPDVVVRKQRNRWVATLNPATVPKLRINSLYATILSQHKSGRSTPLSAQLQEARWMIKNIEQRFSTILRVGQAIVARQQSFFEHGEIAMRPLVLREIAEELELHESTISRVTSAKYMITQRGVFELKYFFGSGVATDAGGAASATAIKAMLKQMVAAEDTKKPLNDSRLTELLEEQGILVARRTVAKYRELAGIGSVAERRSA
jgi:RNA polymerase sigma-54 factor